jgi:hypothetical protein
MLWSLVSVVGFGFRSVFSEDPSSTTLAAMGSSRDAAVLSPLCLTMFGPVVFLSARIF